MKTAELLKSLLVDKDQALPGRDASMPLENTHFVLGTPLRGPFEEIEGDCAQVLLGLGCFWGAERVFWQLEGVYSTAVGYAGGITPNPSYEEVCTGRTGHTEAVLLVFQPSKIDLMRILRVFFEAHDPTQGMRQGNDKGSQYRSAIYTYSDQDLQIADAALSRYQQALSSANLNQITTEVGLANEFYYAEQYHQQYLAKNPNGYCGIGGTGVSCPI